ncbi:MAG: gamma-glutamyl-gamma-aminobutyrate hydrolase family protein [Deltaproteobacteria bacterium]|nr:gamma-glutamyl-gamma-aminobutyrate hydrolase family protein [Deltaproteobacteria bacterium]
MIALHGIFTPMRSHITVIDPAVKNAEVSAFNHFVRLTTIPLTYHLPALAGMDSLQEEQNGIAGIVLLGSASSVNEALPWQISLEKWLLPRLSAGVPTLGICFGHQMIAHLYGAKIAFRTAAKEMRLGFYPIRLLPDRLWNQKTLEGLVYYSHKEVVTSCPAEMKVLAHSPQVAVEALTHSRLPIWTFQCHPEATAGFVQSRGTSPGEKNSFEFGHELIQYFFRYVARK